MIREDKYFQLIYCELDVQIFLIQNYICCNVDHIGAFLAIR